MPAKPDFYYDKRIIARSLARNRITRKEYEQYLKELEDVKEKAVPIFFDDERPKTTDDGESTAGE